jgi:hypothetical protein
MICTDRRPASARHGDGQGTARPRPTGRSAAGPGRSAPGVHGRHRDHSRRDRRRPRAVRASGVAVVRREWRADESAVAVPVLGPLGVVAALELAGSTPTFAAPAAAATPAALHPRCLPSSSPQGRWAGDSPTTPGYCRPVPGRHRCSGPSTPPPRACPSTPPPVGRLGEPDEIARVVEFLADPDSAYHRLDLLRQRRSVHVVPVIPARDRRRPRPARDLPLGTFSAPVGTVQVPNGGSLPAGRAVQVPNGGSAGGSPPAATTRAGCGRTPYRISLVGHRASRPRKSTPRTSVRRARPSGATSR